MPDLLDRISSEQIIKEPDALDRIAAEREAQPSLEPKDEYRQIDETVDISDKLGIPIIEVDRAYQDKLATLKGVVGSLISAFPSSTAIPMGMAVSQTKQSDVVLGFMKAVSRIHTEREQQRQMQGIFVATNLSVWQRAKLYLTRPAPPGGWERSDMPFRTLGKLAAVGAAEAVSGLGLTIPDILAQEIFGEPTLGEAVASGLGLERTPKEMRQAEAAKYISSLYTSGVLTRPLIAKLPLRAASRYILSGATQFGTRELVAQEVAKITVGKPIDWSEVGTETLWGTLFGGLEAIGSRVIRWKRYRDFVKARPEFKNFPPKLMKRMDEAAMSVKEGMSLKSWQKVYGKEAKQFLDLMRQNFGAGPTVAYEIIPTEYTKAKNAIVKSYGIGLRQAQASGDVEAVGVLNKLRQNELNTLEKQTNERAIKEVKEEFQAMSKSVTEAPAEPVKPVEAVSVPEKTIYTSVPEEWYAEKDLYDWGKKGLRTRGNRAIQTKTGRARKSFAWRDEFEEIPVRLPKSTMDSIRAKTDEVFKVHTQKGDDYYIVPKQALKEVRAELSPEAFKQRPKPERTPKQKINDAINAMKRSELDNIDIGENILAYSEELGLTENDLSANMKKYIEEFRNEQKSHPIQEELRPGMEQEVQPIEELEEREAIQQEAEAGEIGDFLDGLIEEERPKDLLGRQILRGGVAGKQTEFLDKEQFKTLQERERINAEQDVEGQLEFADSEIESAIGAEEISAERKGFAVVPEFRKVVDSGKHIVDTILTFGEVRRTNPDLYERLMKTFGKRSAAMETAIDKLEKIMPKTLSLDDDVLLATIYEVKGQQPPERLKELYENFARILEENEKLVLEEGILSKTFQERMIEENLARIASLEETLKHPAKSKRVKALIAENEKLKNMRYLPHTQVARNVIEGKINRLPDDKRKAFLDRLSYIYKKRSGKMTLKDYLDLDIIEKKDIRLSRLAAQTLADYERRSAMKMLHDLAKEQGLIQPVSNELREEGWLKSSEVGIVSPELKNKLLHPLYAQALREMAAARSGRGGLRRELFAMVKIGQFIKPTIIYTYNAVQKMFRGMYSLNPKTEAVALRQAFHHVLNRTELYDKLNQDNLFQFPYEVSRGAQEEQLQQWVNQHDPDIDRAIRYAEKITDTAFINSDISKKQFIRGVFMSAHRAIGKITWMGDKVQRTQSYLINRKLGYNHDDAVKLAAQSHGAYSELSKKYKEFMSKYFFVYSFRLLMPIEMAKVLTEPVIRGAYGYAKTGELPPRHKMERWAKAVIGSIVIPVFVDSYMRWRGFEPEKHLGPVAWKYKKTVVVDGKEYEVVVGLNYILNQPVKYWQRLIAYNPIKPETRWMQAAKNVIKWELHPLYRIFFWDISKNRRSFGTGQQVYDTEANSAVQLAQITGYVFGQSFRFIGGVMDAMGEGEMTELERKNQEKVLEETLSGFDRVLFTALGYKYIRLPLDERKAIAAAQLKKEITTRAIVYHRKYEDKKLQQKIDELEAWAKRMQTWIEEEMK